MKAIDVNGVIKKYNSIPSSFELRPNVSYYNLQDSSVHYADGFRDLVEQTITDEQKKGSLVFDAENDVFTYNVIDKTPEEIQAELDYQNSLPLMNEYEKYKKRQRDGVDAYMMISAEFRLLKLSGELSEAEHNAIEEMLTPIRNEIVAGQWKKGLELLVSLGNEVIGVELYDRLYNQINDYILANY